MKMANQSVMKNQTGSVSALPMTMPHVCGSESSVRYRDGGVAEASPASVPVARLAQNVVPLVREQPRMVFRRTVERAEQRNPEEPEDAGDDERRAPAAGGLVDAEHDERRDGRADRRTAVEERHGPSTLPAGKPFGHGFRRTRPVRRFAEPEQEAAEREAPQARPPARPASRPSSRTRRSASARRACRRDRETVRSRSGRMRRPPGRRSRAAQSPNWSSGTHP